MPVVLRRDGIRFFFYSNESNLRDPPYSHAELGGREAKFWLTPAVSSAYSDVSKALKLAKVEAIVRTGTFLRAWSA